MSQLDGAAERSLSATRFRSRSVCHGTVTSHALNNPTIAVLQCGVDTQRTTSKITSRLLLQQQQRGTTATFVVASGRSDLRRPGSAERRVGSCRSQSSITGKLSSSAAIEPVTFARRPPGIRRWSPALSERVHPIKDSLNPRWLRAPRLPIHQWYFRSEDNFCLNLCSSRPVCFSSVSGLQISFLFPFCICVIKLYTQITCDINRQQRKTEFDWCLPNWRF